MNQKPTSEGHLVRWMTDPRSDVYFGPSFTLRFELLAALAAGKKTNLAAIARQRGLTRAAVSAQSVRCRKLFGFSKPTKHV